MLFAGHHTGHLVYTNFIILCTTLVHRLPDRGQTKTKPLQKKTIFLSNEVKGNLNLLAGNDRGQNSLF